MNFLIRIVISALVAFGLAYLLDGVHIDQFTTALLLALVLAVLNAIVKPLLVILTLPITIITLGLFLLVINAAIILVGDYFLDGFKVDGFWWALLFSILLSVVSSILYSVGKKD
jgi:putative membrane protein